VLTAPQILLQPVSETVNAGFGAAFWAIADGSRPLAYQWFLNGNPIPGATFPLLFIFDAQAANQGSYMAKVTNAAGSASTRTVTLTVNAAGGNPFRFRFNPLPQVIPYGGTCVLRVETDSEGQTSQSDARAGVARAVVADPATYQWFLDGNPISGATDSSYVITGASSSDSGTYTCLATNSTGSVASAPATVNVVAPGAESGRLINVSCRAFVGTGANQLVLGVVVGGQGVVGSEPALIRASGPALAPFGVPGALPDPKIVLNNSAGVVASNAGWGGAGPIAAAASELGAFPWSDPASKDSALLLPLSQGPYTAVVSGASGDTGIALAEFYDATPPASYGPTAPRLVNISSRASVGTGGNVLIAGFVVGGSTSRTVLVRASGPALTQFGVPGVLPDPQLVLNGTAGALYTNNGWAGDKDVSAFGAQVGAFTWIDPTSGDSAILVTLPPGAYTAVASGASGDTGIALIEVYEIP